MSAPQMIDEHAKKDLSIALATETLAEIFISGVSLMDFDMGEIGNQETFVSPKAIPLSVSQASNRSLNPVSVVSARVSGIYPWTQSRLG
ncbi:hypothetical protein FISHEDRAFT_78610 [Fistulina hepatica ATCC 64428]|uniref:Uncharacterized protein n=1 Tax=Fistulina hepatica ATCC 64428 TaxID=1128425 RepID=A0A0D6ZZQ1_9AGAR|nr:hypothetical protein FISHEDRAFT_78610 [Fistulina hepatica ATCC 64428]